MENAVDDVSKAKASNTIGRLLAALLAPVEKDYGGIFREKVADLSKMLSADGENRSEILSEFDKKATDFVSEFFPGIEVRIDVPFPEMKEIFKTGTVKIYENNQSARDLANLGHGAQRCIQMALVRMLAQQAGNQTARTLLLIDEPELYLHPHAIEQLRGALRKLSDSGYQIIYSTHSPLMIDCKGMSNVMLIRKNAARGTFRRLSLPEAIERCTHDHQHQSELMFSLTHAANILFCDAAILAEGKTEKHVLPSLIEAVTGSSLGAARLALVPVDGSGSIDGMTKVLEALDLPHKTIADLDYVFQYRAALNLLPDETEAVESCMAHLKILESEGLCALGTNGLPQGSPLGTAADAFALLANDRRVDTALSRLLDSLRNRGVWLWRKGAIEPHLGITQKNTRAWGVVCERVGQHGVDAAVADPQAIRDLVAWMLT